MSYEQFVSTLIACVEKKLDGRAAVKRQKILKNNGVSADGIALRKPGGEAAPLIYLEGIYKSYLGGRTMEETADKVLEIFRNCPQAPQWDYREILDFAAVRDKIVCRLVNAEKNQHLLKQVPHLPVLDLAIVFYLLISEGEHQNASVLIKNEQMDLWKIPISVLYYTAKENTPKLCPYVLRPLAEVMGMPEEAMPEGPVLVLTNAKGVNGAAALLYPHVPKYIYEKTAGSYYLLPSSVHEFLVVPESAGIGAEQLLEMVREINSTEIAAEDVLSDHIYRFDGNIITEM